MGPILIAIICLVFSIGIGMILYGTFKPDSEEYDPFAKPFGDQ